MGTFDEFIVSHERVELEVNAGKCIARVDGKRVFEGKYVVGDMDDKLTATVKAYKAITEKLLDEGMKQCPEPVVPQEELKSTIPARGSLEELLKS